MKWNSALLALSSIACSISCSAAEAADSVIPPAGIAPGPTDGRPRVIVTSDGEIDDEANHPPVVKLAHARELGVRPAETVSLSAIGTADPDGDKLTFHWWQYREADTYKGAVEIRNVRRQEASFTVPGDAGEGDTIHVVCEVTDSGTPPLTRYQRVVVNVKR